MEGEKWNPKTVHDLIPGTCYYVTLCSQRAFADGIKLRILRWGDDLDYSGGLNIIMRVFTGGRQEVRVKGDGPLEHHVGARATSQGT